MPPVALKEPSSNQAITRFFFRAASGNKVANIDKNPPQIIDTLISKNASLNNKERADTESDLSEIDARETSEDFVKRHTPRKPIARIEKIDLKRPEEIYDTAIWDDSETEDLGTLAVKKSDAVTNLNTPKQAKTLKHADTPTMSSRRLLRSCQKSGSSLTPLPSSQFSQPLSYQVGTAEVQVSRRSSSGLEELDSKQVTSRSSTIRPNARVKASKKVEEDVKMEVDSSTEEDYDEISMLILQKKEELAKQRDVVQDVVSGHEHSTALGALDGEVPFSTAHVRSMMRRERMSPEHKRKVMFEDERKKCINPPLKRYKHSLKKLAKQAQEDKYVEERLKELEERERVADEERRLTIANASNGDLNVDASPGDYMHVVNGNAPMNDTAEPQHDPDWRVKQAMKKLNEPEKEMRYRFFDTILEIDPTRRPFPKLERTWEKWMGIFAIPEQRDQAFLSGFVADICVSVGLPPQVQEWILGEVLFEDREDMAYAYVNVLIQCCKGEKTSSILDLTMLRDAMTRLGARDDIIYEHVMANDEMEIDTKKVMSKAGRQGLESFLYLLSQLRSKLSRETHIAAFYFCNLMLLDDDVVANPDLFTRLQSTVVELVEDISDFHDINSKLLAFLENDPILISRLIQRQLALTQESAFFRRQLAYLHIVGNARIDRAVLQDPNSWSVISAVLSNAPAYSIRNRQSWSEFSASIHIVDIAIGPGFSNFSWRTFDPPVTLTATDVRTDVPPDVESETELFVLSSAKASPEPPQSLLEPTVDAKNEIVPSHLTVLKPSTILSRLRSFLSDPVSVTSAQTESIAVSPDSIEHIDQTLTVLEPEEENTSPDKIEDTEPEKHVDQTPTVLEPEEETPSLDKIENKEPEVKVFDIFDTKKRDRKVKKRVKSEDEKAYEKNVESFARQIRDMASDIRDYGVAMGLKRTEAKVALERLEARLEGLVDSD